MVCTEDLKQSDSPTAQAIVQMRQRERPWMRRLLLLLFSDVPVTRGFATGMLGRAPCMLHIPKHRVAAPSIHMVELQEAQ